MDSIGIPVFIPLFGFSSITAPEVNIEMQEITEGSFYFRRKVIKTADCTPIVCERGVTYADSDFWRWLLVALSGDIAQKFNIPNTPLSVSVGGSTPRRSLMLVQYFAHSPINLGQLTTRGFTSGAQNAQGALVLAENAGLAALGAAASGAGGIDIATAMFQQVVFGAIGNAFGSFEFFARIPAKCWMLYNCLPTRYKVGTDFDAMSSAVSVAQLELAPEMIEEIAIGA